MGRQNRPNIAGAIYHVMNRGNRKAIIFEDDIDRRRFLRIVNEQLRTFDVRMLGGTLMGNHFHMAVLTAHENLSEFMKQVQGEFARYSNWRHGHVGHVFQGRFRHVLIDNDVHLLTALCYIFMNPVAAGLVTKLEDYNWSTFAASVGLKPRPTFLCLDWLESLFPTSTLLEAQFLLRTLLTERRPVAAYLQDIELNVSPEDIKHVLRSYTSDQLRIASLPRVYRTALRPPLDVILRESGAHRGDFIKEARITYGYRNLEIAKALGLRPATVSKLFRAALRERSDRPSVIDVPPQSEIGVRH